MKTIIHTGNHYNDTKTEQIYEITRKNGDVWHYVEPKTGFTGIVLVQNDIVYMPSLVAGDFYPTKHTIEVTP